MKKIINTFCVLFILLFFNICLTSCGVGLKTFAISGYVLGENGAIEGASVSCEVGSTTTDENGYYSFEGLITGVSVYVSHENFYFPTSIRTAFSDTKNLNFNGLEYYSVSGKVVSNSNNPISNAKVVATGIVSCYTYSNTNGEFVLKDVVGKSEISIDKAGYEFETFKSTINTNNSNIVFDGITNVTIKFDDEKEQAYEYDLIVNNNTISIQESKSFLSDIKIGTVITPVKENLVFIPSSVVVTEENQAISFEVYEKYTYSGTILCGDVPLENVEIYLDDQQISKSNANGIFVLEGFYGNHELSCKLNGYKFETIAINSEYLPEFIFANRVILAQILDQNNKPIQTANVLCGNQTLTSDELGFIEIDNAKIGDVLSISKNGYYFEDVVVTASVMSNIYGFKVFDAKFVAKCGEEYISGIKIVINGKELITDANGVAIFENLHGDNDVVISSDQYKVLTKIGEVSSLNCEITLDLLEYYNLNLSFDNISNIRVYLNEQECFFSNNSIIVNNLYGNQNLLIRKMQFNDLSLVINENNCNFKNIQFSYDVDGKVLTDKTPVADVDVIINNQSVATTSSDGSFKLENLVGLQEISFSKEGFSFSKQSVNLSKSIEVQGYYSVYGFVKVDKLNVSSVCVKIQKDLTTVYTAYTDKDGKYEFSNLNGVYSIYVSDDDPYNKHFIEKGYSGVSSYGKYDFVNNSYKISGYIYSGDYPVPKVKITAGEYETFTDDNGKYQFSSLSDEINLILFKEGYTFTGNTLVDDSLSESSVDFSAEYSVKGKIMSGELIVTNVLVKCGAKNFTSEDGSFSFAGLTGANELSFTKEGYRFNKVEISGYEDMKINCSYSVSGVIKTGDVLVENVAISSNSNLSLSDVNGTFTISGLEGRTNLAFKLDNYNFNNFEVNEPSDIEIQCSYNVYGYIKNNEIPVANVCVLLNSVQKTSTDANGYFEIRELTGKNILEYTSNEFEFEKDEITGPFNKIIKATFTVSGRITLNNVPMTEVVVSSGNNSTTTNENGYYELKGLFGRGTLNVYKQGYKFAGEFAYSTATNLDFKGLYSISGVVKSGNLKLSGAKISYLNSSVSANALGEFKIDNLDSEVTLQVIKEDYIYYGNELKFSDLATNVEIQLGYEISGKIQSTKSVENVEVSVSYNDQTQTLKTTSNGEFKFEKIYGSSILIFNKEGFGFSEYYYSKSASNIVVNPTIVFSITGKVVAGSYNISEAVIKAGSFGTFNTNADGTFEIKNVSGTIVVSAILSKTNCQTFNSNQITVSDSSNLTLSFNINDYCFFIYEQSLQMMKENTYESSLTGTVELSVGGTQQVRGAKKKGVDGNILYEQLNYGKEILGIDPRMALIAYYDPSKPSNVYYKTSKDVSTSYVASYGSSWSSKTYNDFKNSFGLDVQGFFSYIISQSTISKIANISKDENGMSFRFVMNTTSSIGNYVKNMNAMSGQTPTGFNYIYINFYFNSKGELTKSICDEEYTIKKGVTVTAHGYITETYKLTNGSTVIQKYV